MSDELVTRAGNKRQRPKGRRMPVDGEIGVRYGNRNFIRAPDQALIARQGTWHLVIAPTYTRDGWMSFKLYSNVAKVRKNLWKLSFRHAALTANSDLDILTQYHPDMLDWVTEQANRYAQGLLPHKPELGKAVIYRKGKGWQIIKRRKSDGQETR